MKQFKSQIVKACYLNAKDAAAKWDQAYNVAGNIKSWLRSMDVDYYHVKSKNIDLKIRHGEKRKWLGIDGANIPSFEIFMSPDWRGTEGIYYADQPAYKGGKLIEGVRLEFKEGKVVKATADRNEDYLNKMVETDEDSCKVGEFSLTDTRLSKIDNFMANTLFDENYGGKYGNCHIAIGGSYSETYDGDPSELTDEIKKELGFSDSVIHWDLINTENKTVTAHMKDGSHTVIYESGIFNN
jgi:aminopeptidase